MRPLLLLCLAACSGGPIASGPGGPERTPPAGTPTFGDQAADLSATWLGFRNGRGDSYDTTGTETDPAGDVRRSFDERERRSYDARSNSLTGESWLELSGVRFLDTWQIDLALSEEDWVYWRDGDSWQPAWPAELGADDVWTGPVTWFSEPGLNPVGTWEVVSLEATTPQGFTAIHVRSTFEEEGYTGRWEAWHTDDGPRYETREITRPSGLRESAVSIWRPL